MFTNVILFPFLIAFIATLVTTPICINIFKRIGLIDDPRSHKHPAVIHKKPIPRGGGIPMFIGITLAGIIFLPLTKIVAALFLAALIALAIGTLDDKFDISPYVRFFINIVVAVTVVGSGIGIPFVTNPLGGGTLFLNTIRFSIDFFGNHSVIIFSDLIAIIWLVWVMNMLNWSKGVDGQMPGIVAISAFVIGILSLRFPVFDQTNLISAKLSFILSGAALGFLFFNFYPAKIFPGYGATAIYLLLGTVSILSSAKLATAILVMGVPMTDGIFTIIRRILSGKSPFWHDKKHLHHLLLHLKFGQRQIALFYWTISAILGSLSLLLSSKGKLFAVIMVIIIVGGMLLFLHFLLRKTNDENNL
ncbi:MAG: undecaprenyl/decaprenyl-phosphate alpha-N-acetylglucosaminyl 1-phosphate transferase [Candidatus Levybacteria bacterium]|nr:undecaprenyl/decaprenyl-phosphate alpha-N-acetylglucosaminyl 1-phosphate transferase [Candidatus Levybacteria bacterium]